MVFSFFNKPAEHHLLETDIHSHIIPNIDDGARDIEESLILLRGLVSLGYKKVITTPHIMLTPYCNTHKSIMDGLTLLKESIAEADIDIQIEAAAEYYLDDGFLNCLKEDDILSINGQYLLFETSYMAKPLQFDEMISEIFSAGYTPLLAHPERYRYIFDLKKEYVALKEKGIFFQVNSNSFGGHYGPEAKRKAYFLSDHGMIDFLGSDVHHVKQVKMLEKVRRTTLYKKVFQKNTILNDTL